MVHRIMEYFKFSTATFQNFYCLIWVYVNKRRHAFYVAHRNSPAIAVVKRMLIPGNFEKHGGKMR
jgi:hypothetical protein